MICVHLCDPRSSLWSAFIFVICVHLCDLRSSSESLLRLLLLLLLPFFFFLTSCFLFFSFRSLPFDIVSLAENRFLARQEHHGPTARLQHHDHCPAVPSCAPMSLDVINHTLLPSSRSINITPRPLPYPCLAIWPTWTTAYCTLWQSTFSANQCLFDTANPAEIWNFPIRCYIESVKSNLSNDSAQNQFFT